MEKINIQIKTEYIKLDQLLKFSGVAESGAEAKYIISSETVMLNGVQVTERGKKIRIGDVVNIGEIEINVC